LLQGEEEEDEHIAAAHCLDERCWQAHWSTSLLAGMQQTGVLGTLSALRLLLVPQQQGARIE
jgi:hypothetical protein